MFLQITNKILFKEGTEKKKYKVLRKHLVGEKEKNSSGHIQKNKKKMICSTNANFQYGVTPLYWLLFSYCHYLLKHVYWYSKDGRFQLILVSAQELPLFLRSGCGYYLMLDEFPKRGKCQGFVWLSKIPH